MLPALVLLLVFCAWDCCSTANLSA